MSTLPPPGRRLPPPVPGALPPPRPPAPALPPPSPVAASSPAPSRSPAPAPAPAPVVSTAPAAAQPAMRRQRTAPAPVAAPAGPRLLSAGAGQAPVAVPWWAEAQKPQRSEPRPRPAWVVDVAIGVGMVPLITVLVVLAVRVQTDLWLPLDAAHFIAEADWLAGDRSLLPGIHPPSYPGLVWLLERWLTPLDSVLVAMALAFALYAVALFSLLRQFTARAAALVATAVAMLLPVQAELIGWGGGANLLGLGAVVATLAATEWWIERGGARCLLVGALLGLCVATHPFAAAMAVALVIGRVLIDVLTVRGRGLGGPRSVSGWFGVLLAAAPFVAVSAYYYTSNSAPGAIGIGWPDLRMLFEFLQWASREGAALLLLQIGALVAPLALTGRRSQPVAVLLAASIVASTMVQADPSYRSRILYLLPALVGIVVAEAIGPATQWIAARTRRPTALVGVAVGGVVLLLLAQLAFVTRLDTAIRYFARIGPADVPLLEAQRGGGVVASSYWGTNVAEPTNWFVNGLAGRPAWSPIGPWLSTIPVEVERGRAMQHLFAGQVGVEDDVRQISAYGTPGGAFGLTISRSVDDFPTPFLTLDQSRSRFPFAIASAATSLDGDVVVLELKGAEDDERVVLRAELAPDGFDLRVAVAPDEPFDWSVVLTPPSTTSSSTEAGGAGELRFTQQVSGERVVADLRASVAGEPAGLRTYGPGQPVDLVIAGGSSLEVTWREEDGRTATSPPVTFDERLILRDEAVEDVAVWRNTGLVERFETGCYQKVGEGDEVVWFAVTGACPAP